MASNALKMTIRGAKPLLALLESGRPWRSVNVNRKDRSDCSYQDGDGVEVATVTVDGAGADRFNANGVLVLLRADHEGRVAALAESQQQALAMVVDLDGEITTLMAQVTR